MDNILKIFTSEDKDELKGAIKQLILNQFESDLEENDCYLFDVQEIEDMVSEAFQEIVEEIKAEYRQKIKNSINEMLDKKMTSILKEI